MLTLLIDLHYLPSLEYFCLVSQFEKVMLEKREHFVKQSYRNRCYINTAQGRETLIIPLTQKHGKTAVSDVLIDYSQKWQNNHWRTIESAYRKAPFFEHYADDLKKILYQEFNSLFQLNTALLSFCLKSLRMGTPLSESVTYEHPAPVTFFDARSLISAKKPYLERDIYQPATYYQVFGNRFVENLSVIDLLFCEGPGATSILLSSRRNRLND